MNGEHNGPPQVVSRAPNRLFYQMKIDTSPPDLFFSTLRENYRIITMDPCWETDVAAAGCYSRIEDEKIFTLFRERVGPLFNPLKLPKGKDDGYLFVWYVHGKEKTATRCIYEAGYELIAKDAWAKTVKAGDDQKIGVAGTAEFFLVGRKTRNSVLRLTAKGAESIEKVVEKVLLHDDPALGGPKLYTSHAFSAPRFNKEHSRWGPLHFAARHHDPPCPLQVEGVVFCALANFFPSNDEVY